MTETLKEKLRKVLALAREGESGERNAAKTLLEKILKENGLTIEDIEDDTTSMHWFKTGKSKQAKALLFQIYFTIMNTDKVNYATNPLLHKGEVGLEITKTQAAEIESKFSVYAPALEKELKMAEKATIHAFYWKNNLMGKTTDKGCQNTPLSQKDIELLHRIVHAGMNMETVQIYKQIDNPSTPHE